MVPSATSGRRGRHPGLTKLLPAIATALPQIRAWRQQIDLDIQMTREGLDQGDLNRSQGTDSKQPQALGQGGRWGGAMAKALNRLMHLQPERFAGEL